MVDPTQRFSNRIENYARFRPGYPQAVLRLLEAECELTSASVVADCGSETSIVSEVVLKNGKRVVGGEPNNEMRNAVERLLAR